MQPLTPTAACAVQISIQAYILWEQAGKPDGADYGDSAKRALEERLRAGKRCAGGWLVDWLRACARCAALRWALLCCDWRVWT